MATNTTKIYGFVSDTAYYNRDFSMPGTTATVDQGACCATDKIANMFGTVGIIKDLRETRTPLIQISDASVWTDAPVELKEDGHYLDGKMAILFDASKYTPEITSLFDLEANKSILQNFFHILELVGYYQKFINAEERTSVSIADIVASQAFIDRKASAGNATVDTLQDEIDVYTKVDRVYSDGESPLNRRVRKRIVIAFDLFDASNNKVNLEMNLWWDRDYFLGIGDSITPNPPSYPLSVITDVVLPCPSDKLYNLLDVYGSVSAFAESASEGKNSVFHITKHTYENGMLVAVEGSYDHDGTWHGVVSSDDHTGVYTFITNYYGYPDEQPNNTFNMSFKVVYKGARPSLDDIKTALRIAVLSILPAHSEEEWRKKLPGIIAERWFFMIPLYDNVWADSNDPTIKHRWGIVDTTQTRIITLLGKCLGQEYVDMAKFAQLIIPKYSKYPVVVVPKLDNPSNSKLFTNIYRDYIGLNASCEDETDTLSSESTITQDFTALFNAALASAYDNDETHGSITGFEGLFETFTPSDGISYYILARSSYEQFVG